MQNFKNHGRMVPLFHYVLLPILLIIIVGASVNLYHNWVNAEQHLSAAILFFVSIALLLSSFFARTFALKAQDRAIRAEENLRHFALTGKLLDSRLLPSQIIALRFASDGELPALAQKAIQENLSNKSIKQAIVNWKEDNYRV